MGRRRRRQEAAEDEVEETPQEKKLRLAKVYLEELRQLGESRPVPAPRRGGPGRRARPSCPVSAAEEERAEEEEEDALPVDLIGDRLKEDVVSSGAGTSPRSRWRRQALPPSRRAGAAPAEPPASSAARAEGPAAAAGGQRCECPGLGLGVPALGDAPA